jgi:hypothetical protein
LEKSRLPQARRFFAGYFVYLNDGGSLDETKERSVTTRQIMNILTGLASGPVLAALMLLIPLGVLTGLTAAINPSLAIDEFAPEEELVIPFILIAALISAANARLAWVMSGDPKTGRIVKVTTARYIDDPSGERHSHRHRGRQFALDFIQFSAARSGDAVAFGAPETEDFGWKFWIRRKDFSPLWMVVAHVAEPSNNNPAEGYIAAVTLDPPFLPWRRLAYKPDFFLRDEVERQFLEFLRVKSLSFSIEIDPWVDPEPKINPGPMF